MAPIGTARAKPGVARKRRRNAKQSDGNDGSVGQRQSAAMRNVAEAGKGNDPSSNGNAVLSGAGASHGSKRSGKARQRRHKHKKLGVKMETIKLRITFSEPILGTAPANEDIYRDFIASKAPEGNKIEDEIEAIGLEAVQEKGMTIFPRDATGNPILWDYQIKGFMKDACSMLNRVNKSIKDPQKATESSKIKAYKKIIDGLIFPAPRQIVLHSPSGIGVCQRPLRASTPQGERVALAMSEELPAGTWCDVEIKTLNDTLIPAIFEWLDYGELRGIGQWRNSGCGRFTYEVTD